MHYTLYKITHIETGKEYIGIHQTKDLNDGYMGSGKYVKRAIEKYGIDAFEKKILYIFDNEEDMRDKEKELVTEEYCLREDTYNLCVGGGYGFSYIHRMGLAHTKEIHEKISKTMKARKIGPLEKNIEAVKKAHRMGKVKYDTFTGKRHTEETKRKMSKSSKGKGIGKENSQYGTMWITNGNDNKKIKKDLTIPEGWYKGRKLNIVDGCSEWSMGPDF